MKKNLSQDKPRSTSRNGLHEVPSGEGLDITLVSTADWDFPLWTNKQHMACVLARAGHRVLYVNSLATRKPRTSKRDMARILHRLRRLWPEVSQRRERVWTISPSVIPWHESDLVTGFNRQLLRTVLGVAQAQLGFKRQLLLTYSPLTTRLLDISDYERVVYHCVDDIAAQPDMPAALIRDAEQQLMERADRVFSSNPLLHERASKVNGRSHYVPNVVDYDHFSAAQRPGDLPADLARIPGPRVMFIGAIASYKLNMELLSELAEARPTYQLIMIGPVGEGEGKTELGRLRDLPNVHFLGTRDYQMLPVYLRGADVAILPNCTNAYTQAMFPMKFFEYLAAGTPVVAMDLPALRDFRHAHLSAADASEFIRHVDASLAGQGPGLEVRLALAKQHTYESRARRMMDEVNRISPMHAAAAS